MTTKENEVGEVNTGELRGIASTLREPETMDRYRAVMAAADLIEKLQAENAALKHDIDRAQSACTEYLSEIAELKSAIRTTIENNLHLADGDNCTLIGLKRAVGYDDEMESEE